MPKIRDEKDQAKWDRIQAFGQKYGVRKGFLHKTYKQYYEKRYGKEENVNADVSERITTSSQFGIAKGKRKTNG